MQARLAHAGTISTLWGTWAGFAVATSASRPAGETVTGSLTRTLTNRSGEPPAGSDAPGSCDQAVAPGSAISTSPPVNTATCAASPATVPRIRNRSTAEATNARRRSMGHVASSVAPVQPHSHSRKSSGASAGSR